MHRGGAIHMEPLTCGMRLDCDWRSDNQRNMIARFVRALRIALGSLKDHYTDPFQSTVSTSDPASYDHMRRVDGMAYEIDHSFPLLQSCSNLKYGKQISFKFKSRLANDRILFLANPDGTNRLVLVEFVRQYAKDAHQLLADHNPPPSLYRYEDLPGRWTMVVMEVSLKENGSC
jgi:hypothetical protein